MLTEEVFTYLIKEEEKYKSILHLARKLCKENVPFMFNKLEDGYQILFYDKNNNRIADLIEHRYSYGNERDLIESLGFPSDDDDVSGNLSYAEAYDKIQEIRHLL